VLIMKIKSSRIRVRHLKEMVRMQHIVIVPVRFSYSTKNEAVLRGKRKELGYYVVASERCNFFLFDKYYIIK
jgi:hypothetical protein